jgi:hypothetical protein
MSSALDRFERSLVEASRTLSAPPAPRPRRAAAFGRPRSLRTAAQLAFALAALGGCAGVAVGGYLLLAGAQARTLPSFECETSRGSVAIIPAVTGSPIVDCAAAWPSASGGRARAPRLAIWGATDAARLVAIAEPASWGPPSPGGGSRWRRLPDTWTVDLPIVAINDQLAGIDQPFAPPDRCSYAAQDVTAVRALLRTDGLDGWRVTVRGQNGPLSSSCRPTIATVDGSSHTVELVQFGAQPGAPPVVRAGPLGRLYARVNRTLAARCESVPAAAALWTREAGAAGLLPATLAFWRAANAGRRVNPDTRYTLYLQPASQRTGRCAHVLVMEVPGSGVANVYVARIAP